MTKVKYLPRSQDYRGHPLIDSSRWDEFQPRDGDVIISTSYKAGTTWTQTIIANIFWQDGNYPEPVYSMSPWLDMHGAPIAELLEGLEAQDHRRFVKTHLPRDGLNMREDAKYIVVGRDGRDVFMSLWNHHTNYTEGMGEHLVAEAKQMGREFKLDYSDIHELWRDWTTQSWYPWESDGFPYWSHLHHAKTWWEVRHLPNVCFVHFADLLKDPEAEIRRIAGFLDVDIDEAMMPGILERTSFGDMKKNFRSIMPNAEQVWRGGGASFMNKGKNGRWKDVLSAEELKAYDAAVARSLEPDCATWLEGGGPVVN